MIRLYSTIELKCIVLFLEEILYSITAGKHRRTKYRG